MAIIDNRQLIASPAPGLRRYGLFDAATVTDDLDGRMIASGFQFAAMDCGSTVNVYDANCETHPEKVFDEGLGYVGGDPYWLYAAQQCGTVGRTPDEITEGVRRTFMSGEQTAVENVIWNGSGTGTLPFLTDPALTVPVVTPLGAGAGAAIAALEEAFYSVYGYVGTIHVNMAAYAALSYAQVMNRAGGAGVLTTPMGSRIAAGAGYGITGPDGVAPAAGSVWAFMTPQVMIKRSQMIVPDVIQTLDRTNNQFNALAERVYAHAWACDVLFAVEVPVAAPGVSVVPEVAP